MKKSRRGALLAVTALSLLVMVSFVAAQQGPVGGARPAVRSAPAIALLNVSKVMKENLRLKQTLQQIQKDAKSIQGTLKARGERIQQRVQSLRDELVPGSPDYKRQEAAITHEQAKLQADAALEEKQLRERETEAYYGAYQEMQQVAKYIATNNGIALVLRTTGADTVKVPSNQQEVISQLNKPVVWHNGGLDITQAVLREIHRFQPPAGSGQPVRTTSGTGRMAPARPGIR